MADSYEPVASLIEGNGVPIAAIRTVLYLNEEGEQCIGWGFMGDSPMTTYLGLLRITEHRLIEEFYADEGC